MSSTRSRKSRSEASERRNTRSTSSARASGSPGTNTCSASRFATPNGDKRTITASSGNVFADLGLPRADERLAKAQLAHEICLMITAEKLTQTQAARRLGLDQPKVSALMRGRLVGFSAERLMRFLILLGRDVDIVIRRGGRNGRGDTVRVVRLAG
jgi:predicted XRE-type DNA-binding protein